MRFRRKGREYALQILFQSDVGGASHHAAARFATFWADRVTLPDARTFAEALVRGVEEHAADIDRVLQRHAHHWSLDRMATVDRNVLRLAIYELMYREDVPPRVALNEAIDIAKKYGSEESGGFVNGVLDDIVKSEPTIRKRMATPEDTHASDLRR